MDDCLRYALVSGKKALEQAGLKQGSDAFEKLNKQRCGDGACGAATRRSCVRGGERQARAQAGSAPANAAAAAARCWPQTLGRARTFLGSASFELAARAAER